MEDESKLGINYEGDDPYAKACITYMKNVLAYGMQRALEIEAETPSSTTKAWCETVMALITGKQMPYVSLEGDAELYGRYRCDTCRDEGYVVTQKEKAGVPISYVEMCQSIACPTASVITSARNRKADEMECRDTGKGSEPRMRP